MSAPRCWLSPATRAVRQNTQITRSATSRLAKHSLVQTRTHATEAAVHEPRQSNLTPQPDISRSRREKLRDAKPFSDFLTDTFQRQHDYLRISVTERCNLRCVYCMPEEGVPLSPNRDVLTTPEIVMLSSVFVSQGVSKIRLTGGEPTVRRDILPLMHQIGALRPRGLKEICITTNGLSLHRKLDSMVEAGLTGVNLSLDTLDPWQFQIMTRRKGFDAVQRSIARILEMNNLGAGVKLKINCVVMRGVNDREILPFVELTREKDIEIRFIEYMPFDGNKWSKGKMFSYSEMLDVIRAEHPTLSKVQDHKNDTSKTWKVPGFSGKIGFITSMTHNFCGTCNRLRITSDGNLKVCLFGNAEVSLRDILRKSNNDEPIDEEAYEAMKKIEMDRREGLISPDQPLGIAPNEAELLDVIGLAVKGKKEKHAGLGTLEHMKNRPMILIDSAPSSLLHMSPRAQQLTRAHLTRGLISTYPSGFTSRRLYSSSRSQGDTDKEEAQQEPAPRLTHVSESGAAHMVSIASKASTSRTAVAACHIRFSSPTPLSLILSNQLKKGDVLGVARIAGIMAAKRTADLIPLCHPIAISHVSVDLTPYGGAVQDKATAASGSSSSSSSSSTATANSDGISKAMEREETSEKKQSQHGTGEAACGINVRATVECDGKTGVEMEALTAASVAALTVYDMCKAVDKGMVVEGLRVVLKDGGKSGRWEME